MQGRARIITLFDLVIVTALVMIGWFIWQNAGFRDRAIGFAKQHCDSVDVQLLDDTISLVRLRIERDRRGNLALARYYEFEFTVTGDRRYRGYLTLFGSRVKSVDLQAHRVH